ncbi:hypothetical protein PPL_06488 [Heterostelium album PN500]|uniref:Uncharacterized protein n=1 Tax=Heterostelium pallidum (strain ATCC 26659 / Pp 5 / PN500) TaxID=670386 RepID=D3BDA5_HETP5|nr:hypothetical protein PPL_06488 [Heterostelium album PN500]EFA80549.1 hypothetical protein PPL_06488 [Heterostelium album PN500]|eukprot:XP_020432669.1 hypothetical protein PPL_06488 [Heterostelium album PN500]
MKENNTVKEQLNFNKMYKNDNHSKSTEPDPVQAPTKQEMREYYKIDRQK